MDNSIQILPLKPFTREDLEPFMAPYESGELYRVEKVESEALTTFTIRLERLEQPYRSDFKQDFEEEEDFQRFLGLLGQGVSFGAYQNGALVALAICEARSDKTLWIWEFHVVERLRRQGLGKALMAQVIAKARQEGILLIRLETQNTNVPAVRFYREMGFSLDAIDLSLYFGSPGLEGVVCFFMKRTLT